MTRLSLAAISLLLICACAGSSATDSSTSAHAGMAMGGDAAAFQDPIDFIPSAIGKHRWTITTASTDAQNYFNQGMQLRWAFNVDEAARSMAEARRIDGDCAMCYWGEAFALGSFLNGGMSATKAPYAHEAIEKAVSLAANVTELERDLIIATRVRYPADYDPENRRPVDEAFAVAMAEVYEKYPDNHDVAAVYAVALFMLEERRADRDLESPELIYLHSVLIGVLDENIRHPGACHLYIHATESSQDPGLALECADYLSDAVPIASHIQHMPSHTWNEVGLWGRSVRANTQARISDLKAAENRGFSYGPSHNLHMLLFAASFDGQGAVAVQAGKDYAKLGGNSMYHVLTMVRFGRFDEIPAIKDRPDGDIPGGFWDFAQGYAALRQGDLRSARRYLDKVHDLAHSSSETFRRHSARNLLGTLTHILEGEILREEGDLDAAIEAFGKAVEHEDALAYDEPEPLPFAARHWLGTALIDAGKYEQAEQVFRDELADHAHNGWSLFGLKAALDGQGMSDSEVDEDFDASWARADIWLVSPRP